MLKCKQISLVVSVVGSGVNCFPPEPNFRLYCIHNTNSSTNITQPQPTTTPITKTHFTIHYESPGTFFTKYINVKPQSKKTSFHQRLHIRQIFNDKSADFFKAVGAPTPQRKTLFIPSIPKLKFCFFVCTAVSLFFGTQYHIFVARAFCNEKKTTNKIARWHFPALQRLWFPITTAAVVFWSRFMAQDSCPTEDPKHPQVDRQPESRRI